LSSSLQIYLFRITQEAINNVIKHASAKNVLVTLSYSQNSVYLSIADDGKGFDVNQVNVYGNGMMNIMERVKSFKGECKFHSELEKGTQIEIIIPVNSI